MLSRVELGSWTSSSDHVLHSLVTDVSVIEPNNDTFPTLIYDHNIGREYIIVHESDVRTTTHDIELAHTLPRDTSYTLHRGGFVLFSLTGTGTGTHNFLVVAQPLSSQ